MRIPLALVCFLLTLRVSAPDTKALIVIDNQPVDIYEKLMLAILEVESGGDTLAYNPVEEAYGPFQIRPIRLTDYNIRTGKKYRMRDCYTMHVSKEVFLYYAKILGPDYEIIARRWNGSGAMTTEYWAKVRGVLKQMEKSDLKPES